MNLPAKVRAFNPRIIYTKRQRKGERQEVGKNLDSEGCIKIVLSVP